MNINTKKTPKITLTILKHNVIFPQKSDATLTNSVSRYDRLDRFNPSMDLSRIWSDNSCQIKMNMMV